MVRAALALNRAAPAQANAGLAQDPEERVRALLGCKLATLLPCLDTPEQAALQQHTWELLAVLVRDTAVRVRAAIATVLKDMPQAPRTLILRLARDTEITVSEPVIRFSPLLTSADLLALLADVPASAIAVARRARIDEAISAAIGGSANHAAIRKLLENPSAQIREATLDTLIVRAIHHADWHAPLVHRPELPPRAANALAEIVATQLLEVLAARADLSPELAESLRARLAVRLAADQAADRPSEELTLDEAVSQARRVTAEGGLTEDTLIEAAMRGEARLASALLAVAAGLSVAVVERAASLRSAKGLVSLIWQAGFTMRAAPALQILLTHLPPTAVLAATPDGDFPLTVDEMRWQIKFLGQIGR